MNFLNSQANEKWNLSAEQTIKKKQNKHNKRAKT